MKKILLSIIALVLLSCCDAQHLKRSGYLGVYPVAVSMEIAQKAGLTAPKGVLIQRIIPKSTVALLSDIKVNDILLKVNGTVIHSVRDVLTISRQLKGGDKISLTVWQNAKERQFTSKVSPRPYEASQNSEVLYDEVPFEGGYLRCIVNKPKTGNVHPAIFFVQGYDCGSIDNLPDASPFKRLIEGWLAKGYAVFRVEKPGVGDSQGTSLCMEIGYEKELAAFDVAYQKFLSYDFIDKQNLFIYGHSLGGITGPLLAEKYNPKGLMVYGTAVRPWYEYLVDIFRTQQEYISTDYARIDEEARKQIALYSECLLFKKTPKELVKNPDYVPFIQDAEKGILINRHYTFWQELQEKKVIQAFQKTNSHVLSMFGEADIEAISSKDMERIAAIVNRAHPGKGTYKFIPRTNHALLVVGSMQEGWKLRNEPNYRELFKTNFNEEYIEILSNWMKGIIGS